MLAVEFYLYGRCYCLYLFSSYGTNTTTVHCQLESTNGCLCDGADRQTDQIPGLPVPWAALALQSPDPCMSC